MTELYIRIEDKVHFDPVRDRRFSKRGDVITAHEDNWPWGLRELTGLSHRIVRISALPFDAEVIELLQEEVPINFDPEFSTRAWDDPLGHFRFININLDALPAGLASLFIPGTRPAPIITFVETGRDDPATNTYRIKLSDFRALKQQKTRTIS